ncbi:hypothetical protein STRMOE7_10705 [Streptomyces sp. MOE7]|nr:hypothetical protein STRMOE7_10705 [Streptomyces sp. MOE7]
MHFRESSKNGVIKHSTIRDNGQNGSGMGEGVHAGSAGGTDDKSRHATNNGYETHAQQPGSSDATKARSP